MPRKGSEAQGIWRFAPVRVEDRLGRPEKVVGLGGKPGAGEMAQHGKGLLLRALNCGGVVDVKPANW